MWYANKLNLCLKKKNQHRLAFCVSESSDVERKANCSSLTKIFVTLKMGTPKL